MAGERPHKKSPQPAWHGSLNRALTANVTQAWTHRGGLAWLLRPLSLLYRTAVAWRRWNFSQGISESHRVKARVIVVGNVVAGGAGKTPVVMALVAHLQARGLRVGVISRGHGRNSKDCREVLPTSLASEVGDEPALIRRKTQVPVVVAIQRTEAALALLARYPQTQVIVSDDGLQHYALQRDLEICVMDDRGIGNGFLLPAGPLREPWPRPPLGRKDAKNLQGDALWPPIEMLLLHTGLRAAMNHGFKSGRSLATHAVRADGSRLALADLRGQPLQAVAAIAQPEAFFAMLRNAGLNLAYTDALPDHADFDGWTPHPGQAIPLLCTEKDAAKLWANHPEAWAVPLNLTLEPAFLAAVDRVISQWPEL